MEEAKKQSVSSKKALAEQTRAFMKLAPEEASAAFQDLLRAYQVEVESLSKRCRMGENAFTELRSGVSQLPLATPSQIADKSDEIRALKLEVKDLEAELNTMRNQDVQVRRLEARLRELESQRKYDSSALESEFARRHEDMELQFANRTQQLQSELEFSSNRVLAAEAELVELNKVRMAEKQKMDQLMNSKQDEILHLSQKVEDLQVKEGTANSQAGSLDMYKDLLGKSEERLASVEQELRSARSGGVQDKAAFEAERGALNAQLWTLAESNKELSARYAQLTAVVNELSGGGVDDPETGIQETVSDLRARVETQVRDLDVLKHEKVRLEEESRSKSEKISALSARMASEDNGVVTTAASSEEVVGIIQAQRDRFRTRVLELESERDNLKQSQFDASNRINVLSSEIRKIENERNFWKSQSSEVKTRSPGDIELGPVAGTSTPPTLASVKRRMNGSNEVEQSLTAIIVWGLGNPVTRRAAFAYLLTLHLLVFFVLYRLSSIVSSSSK